MCFCIIINDLFIMDEFLLIIEKPLVMLLLYYIFVLLLNKVSVFWLFWTIKSTNLTVFPSFYLRKQSNLRVCGLSAILIPLPPILYILTILIKSIDFVGFRAILRVFTSKNGDFIFYKLINLCFITH
ncbi:hypothetical protein LCGC14_0175850 [marine sediment metagenome]|uniref:Uncharacterized protein n=1 Tax=marine sediment metagenome TaxID=412755 RepID=A0A0F9X9Q0_9ZZZZ